ncbi:MAG: SDR family oxidoreductase [Pseudomonadota bacterium]
MTEKIALVTGASRGFGFAAARALGLAGWHVVAVARTVGGLEELDDAVQTAGGQTVLVPLDITDDPGLERMGAALHGRFGRVDLWLHTAVHAPPLSPAEHVDAKDLDKTIAVNVRAFQRLIRVVDPLLRFASAPHALITAEDEVGSKFFGAYRASKAAQSALTQAWAAEAAAKITVAEIIPPPMPTATRARFFPGEDRRTLTEPAEVAERLIARLDSRIAPGERILL